MNLEKVVSDTVEYNLRRTEKAAAAVLNRKDQSECVTARGGVETLNLNLSTGPSKHLRISTRAGRVWSEQVNLDM